ncbi:hypothetical protein M1523_00495 [Patescibacteria group bacterium]|nr:hypothetical protein [Patescibacteria group bacterium]MCL5091614.1 hypothetical protein [Patescibacteria group bacterium]
MTLTEVSYYSRRYMPAAILVFLLVLILYYSLRLVVMVGQTQRSTVVSVNPAFGKIPRPVLEKPASVSGQLNYVLDTIEGQPVTSTAAAQVFRIPEATPNFSYLTKIYLVAKNIGFDTETVKHTKVGNEAVFDDGTQKLSIDITNYNFTYDLQFAQDHQLFASNGAQLQQSAAEQKAVDFLQLVDRYPDGLAQGKTNTTFFRYDINLRQMQPLPSADGANVVEVDFYRPDIAGYPTVSSQYLNSQNYVIMAVDNDGSFRVLRAQVRYYDVSSQQVGVYPVISGDTAFSELKAGHALFVNVPVNGGTVNIKTMFLGYYDPTSYQPYFEPIYVFWGDNQFAAYVPALTSEYYQE